MDPRTANTETAPADIETIENVLGELELGADGGDIAELDASDENVLDVMEAIDEAHAGEVVSETSVPASAEEVPAATAEKKERKARAPRDLNALDPSVFVLDEGELPSDASKAAVIAKRPAQKKIAEKFDNLFQSIAAGKKPSVYVMACFDVLVEKKTVTQTDLVAALKATSSKKGSGYSEGTARSQAGQIMALFDVVGIATREKQTLTLNDHSAIATKLVTLA